MLLRRLPALLCAAACGQARPPPTCEFAGDAAQPVQLEAFALDASGAPAVLREGDAVLLQRPPQGGYVIYAGVAARNLEPCGVTVTAYLIDRATGNALTNLDQRRADLTSQSNGYGFPAQSYTQTPNIPACPDALHAGVVGRAAILHAELTDARSRGATIEVGVIASCASDARCACLCGPNPSQC